MKKLTALALSTLVLAFLIISSCKHQPALKPLVLNLPSQTLVYNNSKYQQVIDNGGSNAPTDNQLTDAGATLGRVLFYDPRLSVNNTVSCSSCHKQEFGFGDNQSLSTGFQGQSTTRNTPALVNEVNKSVFFWDGRVNQLETQTIMPVQNHIEMGLENYDALPGKLASISYYPGLFQSAFGNSQITTAKIQSALSQFVRSIVSSPNTNSLSADANAGETLFFGKFRCGNCHQGINLGGAPITISYVPVSTSTTSSVPNSSNIGLDMVYTDPGIGALTGNSGQNGYFIIPSLVNVTLTAPYMHDGRFSTLSQVLDHYSSTILPNPQLDPLLIDTNFVTGQIITHSGPPVEMNMSATEKQQLIAFLTANTDYTITTDPRFSSPFK